VVEIAVLKIFLSLLIPPRQMERTFLKRAPSVPETATGNQSRLGRWREAKLEAWNERTDSLQLSLRRKGEKKEKKNGRKRSGRGEHDAPSSTMARKRCREYSENRVINLSLSLSLSPARSLSFFFSPYFLAGRLTSARVALSTVSRASTRYARRDYRVSP